MRKRTQPPAPKAAPREDLLDAAAVFVGLGDSTPDAGGSFATRTPRARRFGKAAR